MPRRQIPILILSLLATSSAFAQDSPNTEETSQTVTLTISEFQTEIERACSADAKQARQFRAQRELSDRLSASLSRCDGALRVAQQNDSRALLGAAEQKTKEDSYWYWVGVAGTVVSTSAAAFVISSCKDASTVCVIGSGISAASALGVGAIWWFRW